MSIERLTAEDRIMLWADEVWPQEIGALAILDGAGLFDGDGRFRIEAVRQVMASRLHLQPRFRQLLREPPEELGGPLWVDAPNFDLAEHVQVLGVPAPGGEAELLQACEQLRRTRLDRSRPLWAMSFLTGLPEGRVGWLVKFHHAIADGIAGVATFGAFLDTAPETAPAPAQPWTPVPAPAEAELLADEVRRRRSERRLRVAALAHPARELGHIIAVLPALRELLAEGAMPPNSLDRTVGADRRLALVRSQLEVVKEIAHACDAKVNDVLLAAIAGGLRALLRHRGELERAPVMRLYVPVTLRPVEGRAEARGNEIAEMMVPVPVGEADPVTRLRRVAAETARRKARTRPNVGTMPHSGLAGRSFLWLINRQRVNVCTADLVGPPVPLYLAGTRLLEVFPLLPLIGRVSLGVGALSYAGQFEVMVVADRETFPDLEVFAAGLREELETLAAAVGTGAEATPLAAVPA